MYFEINQFVIHSDIELPLKRITAIEGVNKKQIKVFHLNNINIPSKYRCVLSKNSNIDVYLYDEMVLVNYKTIDVKLEISCNHIAYDSGQSAMAILPILSMGIATLFNLNGMSPIHAASFYYGGNAYVIAGDSGSGKSSLLASILSNNVPVKLICDDLVPIVNINKSVFTVGSNGFIKQWKYNIARSPWLSSLEWVPLQPGVEKYYSWCDTTIDFFSKIVGMFVLKPVNYETQISFMEICDYKEKLAVIYDKYYCKNFMFKDKSFANNVQNGFCFADSVKIYNLFYMSTCPKDHLAKKIIDFIDQKIVCKKEVGHD